jgi:tRNA(Met) cytidine acetyltransferase
LPDYIHYIDSITALQADAIASNQRRMLVISGSREWCHGLAEIVHNEVTTDQSLWVSQSPMENGRGIPASQAHMLLGAEIDMLVMDCHDGLDANALAASSGALLGGGLLLLLTPDWQRWSLLDAGGAPFSLFIQYFQRSLEDAGFLHLSEGVEPPVINYVQHPPTDISYEDQQQAVTAIIRVSRGHRRRPLVMTADRGRGKSSALGMASAQLMKGSGLKIIVTAPRSESLLAVFSHAASQLGIDQHGTLLAFENSVLEFVAPDELIRSNPAADLVLVDEAAAIPSPMLAILLERYSRIVFSTTIHGYEGTGRGFAIRFRKVLDELTPQWKSLHLKQAIRWADNDPVEQWLFNALCLNATVQPATEPGYVELKKVTISCLDRQDLIDDPGLLSQLFGLLVLAHYQTSPNDLRLMLDDPAVSIWVTRYEDTVLATVLLVKEGGFDDDLAQAIWLGKRRPAGNMLPQVLSAHNGFKEAAGFTYWRLMRVAVHPDFQRLELGSKLIRTIGQQAIIDDIDLMGSSFAATEDVLSFWHSSEFTSVRMGITRDACSGAHSAVVVKGLSTAGKDFAEVLTERFSEQLPWQLPDSLRDIEPGLVSGLLSSLPVTCLPELSAQDRLDLQAYTSGARVYDSCSLALWKFLLGQFMLGRAQHQLTATRQGIMIGRVLQRKGWPELIEVFSLKGKKQAEGLLREGVGRLMMQAAK